MSEQEIIGVCVDYGIMNYTIRDDGLVDVDGSVYINQCDLLSIPLRFGKVSGDFVCSSNKLTSLKGCPSEVGEYFDCSANELTSLEFIPLSIRRGIICSDNRLTTLECCPTEVGGVFDCSNNQLTSMEFCPTIINGLSYFGGNPLPSVVRDVLLNLPREELCILFLYQHYYDVWCPEFSEENLLGLISDIKEGLK